MRVKGTTLAFCLAFGCVAGLPPGTAEAATKAGRSSQGKQAEAGKAGDRHQRAARAAKPQRVAARAMPGTYSYGAGISCVPYARAVTGMAISGNGGQWWWNAAGLYDRGQRPEPGSVMVFRESGGMSRGHVAVVRRVLGERELLIDHANWGGPGIRRGTVMQNVAVIDVSDRNDWTAVRVQVGHDRAAFGRTYATHGFIYNRPDAAAGTLFAGQPLRRTASFEQLAEAPAGMQLTPQGWQPIR